MNPCSETLKAAREKLNLSLEDISTATRINIKFLKAIEEGDFNFLNEVYVRAFIREFAKQVGLDPEECIKKYIQSTKPERIETETIPKETIPIQNIKKQKGVSNTTILIIISSLIVIFLLLSLYLFKSNITEEPTNEIDFQEAVKQMEQQNLQIDTTVFSDSSTISSKVGQADSLILSITARESAWISVLIDEKNKNEILLMPNQSVVWKAADNFKLTTGNAGALEIKLNNKRMTSIGKRGAVVKDVVFNRKNLE